mgnify:CR=1 FL=1
MWEAMVLLGCPPSLWCQVDQTLILGVCCSTLSGWWPVTDNEYQDFVLSRKLSLNWCSIFLLWQTSVQPVFSVRAHDCVNVNSLNASCNYLFGQPISQAKNKQGDNFRVRFVCGLWANYIRITSGAAVSKQNKTGNQREKIKKLYVGQEKSTKCHVMFCRIVLYLICSHNEECWVDSVLLSSMSRVQPGHRATRFMIFSLESKTISVKIQRLCQILKRLIIHIHWIQVHVY